jgi:hypothetical protein
MMDFIPKSKIEIPAEMHTSAMPKLNLESMAFWLSIIALFSTIAMAIVRPSSSQWDFINDHDAGLSVRIHSNPSSNRVQKPRPGGEKEERLGRCVQGFASEFCAAAWH